MDENSKHEALVEQVATAVKEGRDDLAEAGIAKQLDIEAQIPVLEKAVAEAGEREKELEGYIQALQAKRREMKDELKRMLQTARESEAAAIAGSGVESAGSSVEQKIARAESAFERVMEKQTGLSGSSGSRDREAAAKLAELEELNRNNRIQERLAAIKAQSGSS
jgi:phage shock protein A